VAYSWHVGCGDPWFRTTMGHDFLVDNGHHGQDCQTYHGSHDLGLQDASEAKWFPSIKDTPQTSAHCGIDKAPSDNTDKRAQYKGPYGHAQECWHQIDHEERKDRHQTEHEQVAQGMFPESSLQPG